MLLKNPFFLGLAVVNLIALQVAVSYWSYRSLMADDFISAFLFFFSFPFWHFSWFYSISGFKSIVAFRDVVD